MMTLRNLSAPRSTIGLAGAFLLMVATGCQREPAAPPESYRVHAQVRQVPAPDATRGEILVRHEAIPSFKNADGETVGMDSMSMSFPLADVALTAGLVPGDRIEMAFEVSWSGGNPLKVTAIEKLPEGTRLAFETDAPETSEEVTGGGPETEEAASGETEAEGAGPGP